MKSLRESLFDKDLVSKDLYKYSPTTKRELIDIIVKEIEIQGKYADLNNIDVSKIKDMSCLFLWVSRRTDVGNIDISLWNVSNVKDMNSMFAGCYKFNSDLSKWDVGNVKDMMGMFHNCYEFNSDLSKWDVGNVKYMRGMFACCEKFNSDLSKWDVRNVKNMKELFYGCYSLKKIPSWYEES